MSGARKEDDPLIEIAELDAHPSSGLFMSALIVPEAISPRYECAPSDAAETNVHRVGQNLFEEINILKAGGNYGWSVREGLHPFGFKGVGPREDLIEPIWEYHHDVGKSITGGHVYRGKRLPDLVGYYVYADYVSGKIWGLKYDEKAKKVVANRQIAGPVLDGERQAHFRRGSRCPHADAEPVDGQTCG